MYAKISKYVDEHKDELVELHRQLVRTPSAHPDPDYTNIRNLIVEYMEEIGLEVDLAGRKGKENVIGHLKGTTDKPILMFHTHMDTVNVGDVSKWKYPPFSATIEEGKIFGRGAADNKSSVASLLMAAKAIKALDIPLKGEVFFISNVDEEIGSKDGIQYLANSGKLDNVDMSVMCAKTKWMVPVILRGNYRVKLETFGVAAHPTSRGDENAVHKMIEALSKIIDLDTWMKYKIPPRMESGDIDVKSYTTKPIVTASIIQGGIKSNIIPDYCTAEIDMRLLPGQTCSQVRKEIEHLMQEIGIRVEIEDSGRDPIEISSDNPLVNAAFQTTEIVTGKKGKVCEFSSNAEVCYLIPLGIFAIKFGAGGTGGVHSYNEFVETKTLLDEAKAYAILTTKLLS